MEHRLCAECREAKIKSLEDEIAKIDGEIEKSEIALAALKTARSSEGELEDEELIRLRAKRKKMARELDHLKANEDKK